MGLPEAATPSRARVLAVKSHSEIGSPGVDARRLSPVGRGPDSSRPPAARVAIATLGSRSSWRVGAVLACWSPSSPAWRGTPSGLGLAAEAATRQTYGRFRRVGGAGTRRGEAGRSVWAWDRSRAELSGTNGTKSESGNLATKWTGSLRARCSACSLLDPRIRRAANEALENELPARLRDPLLLRRVRLNHRLPAVLALDALVQLA